ncbi:MAG: LysM domain-containing protein [Patescibacteria group bacterium]
MPTLAAVVGIFFVIGAANAIDYSGIGGRPANPDPAVPNSESWFIYHLGSDEMKEDAVVIQNTTPESERIVVYAADSTPSTDGGFALEQQVEEKNEVGAWVLFYPEASLEASDEVIQKWYGDTATTTLSIAERCKPLELYSTGDTSSLSEEEAASALLLAHWCAGVPEYAFDLGSQELVVIPFIIRIPEDVSVGEHTGGIMVQKAEVDESAGAGIKLTTRLGVRIYEIVPGEIMRDLAITKFEKKYLADKHSYIFSVGVRNEGNVSQDFTVTYSFSNALFGIGDAIVERSMQVLRDDELVSNLEWQPPKIGWVRAQAVVRYEDDGQSVNLQSGTLTVLIIPWLELGILAGAVLILLTALLLLRRSRARLRDHTGWKPYIVRKGDAIQDLAGTQGVGWQKIALVNKIRPPYVLTGGQEILLPAAVPGSVVIPVKVARRRTKPKSRKKSAKNEEVFPSR